jgi:hypothetical protein
MYFSQNFENSDFSWESHGHEHGVFGGKLLFEIMSAGGRLCA